MSCNSCRQLYNLRISYGRSNFKHGIKWLLRKPVTIDKLKLWLNWDLKWTILDTRKDIR